MPKGQHSWNISVTKEARMDPRFSGIVDGMPFGGNLFLPVKKIVKTNEQTSKFYRLVLNLCINWF